MGQCRNQKQTFATALIKRCFVVFVSPLVFINKNQKVNENKKAKGT